VAPADLRVGAKVRNMVVRAGRELTVTRGDRFGPEHRKLVQAFLRSRRLGDALDFIFSRVPRYAATETARIYDARDARGKLVAFDVAEFGARDVAFYAFNFRSAKRRVPGASDLLLDRILEDAREEGKRWVNLGLGIHPGVRFFKEKWGGEPFLTHVGSYAILRG
jgi:hypothetical protein